MSDMGRRRNRPFVRAFLIDGDLGRRKIRVAERAYRDRNEIGQLLEFPKDGRAAHRAKVKAYWIPAVADPDISGRAALNLHTLSWKAGLKTEGAAGPLLAGEAMAHRDPHRLPIAFKLQLSAGT